MANQEHLSILKRGVETWNQWRKDHANIQVDLSEAQLNTAYLVGANLSKANFNGASLFRANLFGAYLSEANLNKAYLCEVNLNQANLNRANLTEADLAEADLVRTDLSFVNLAEANLSSADLSFANLNRTKMDGANLSRTELRLTVFGDVDLRAVKGLDAVIHLGPSTIGIDTVIRSEGNIPEVFLRGAGVPDTWIVYARSLVGQPVDYFSCFISYSSKDEAFARRLYTDLQNKGVRCWYAPEDLKIGDKFRQRIDESIRLYNKLLLVLSESSLASTWVAYEVEKPSIKSQKGFPMSCFPSGWTKLS